MLSTEAVLWIATGTVAVVLLLISERAGFAPGVALAKITASTCFVGLALSLGLLATPTGQIMVLGMILCWLGDALLLPPGQSAWFQLGIGAFLLGHVAFAASFAMRGVAPLAVFAAGLVVFASAWRTLAWLGPHVPSDFSVAVRCYVIVIAVMVILAVGATAAGAAPPLALGAIAFALSDLSVARERFVHASFANSLWGLPLYYLSQVLLATGHA